MPVYAFYRKVFPWVPAYDSCSNTQAKGTVKKTGIVFFQYPEGVDFGAEKAQLWK